MPRTLLNPAKLSFSRRERSLLSYKSAGCTTDTHEQLDEAGRLDAYHAYAVRPVHAPPLGDTPLPKDLRRGVMYRRRQERPRPEVTSYCHRPGWRFRYAQHTSSQTRIKSSDTPVTAARFMLQRSCLNPDYGRVLFAPSRAAEPTVSVAPANPGPPAAT